MPRRPGGQGSGGGSEVLLDQRFSPRGGTQACGLSRGMTAEYIISL